MRIGIWCDYGKTLVPSEGIGVFVHNLAANLVKVNDCEVLLVAAPGDTHLLTDTVSRGVGRIQVAESPIQSSTSRFLLKQFKSLRWKRFHQNPVICKLLDRGISLASRAYDRRVSRILDRADVWILPYLKIEFPVQRPSVVCIHDLVSYHYPEMMRPHKLQELKDIVRRVADDCTIAACMSNFIKQNDLIGQLHLPEDKIRVVRAAVPDDIAAGVGSVEQYDGDSEVVSLLKMQYLFYPSAFRLYKNHVLLIRALRELKDRSKEDWKVAFTGIHSCPDYIQDEIKKQGLSNDVVVLSHVSRGELLRLYRGAFATVVPSLYEQGSFPLMEAISQGCPIMSSNIPSLKEQFEQIGEDMLFFDPHNPSDLVSKCLILKENRSKIIASQQAGFAQWKSYRGVDAARNWYEVCREAIEMDKRRKVGKPQ